MTGTSEDGEDIRHSRRHEGDVLRILAQDAGGDADHQVETAGGLHRCRRRNDRHDHQHDVDRRAGRLQAKTKGQNGETQTAENTETDATDAGAQQNTQQHDGELHIKHYGHNALR